MTRRMKNLLHKKTKLTMKAGEKRSYQLNSETRAKQSEEGTIHCMYR